MKIIPLSEGRFTVDKSKEFVPFNSDLDTLENRPIGSLLVEIQPFVLITDQDIILLDTGLGYSVNGELQLHQNLTAAGIDPAAVTKVILSHLHKDHAGGVAFPAGEEFVPAFSHASYFVQKPEMDYALSKTSASFQKEKLEWLASYRGVEWLQGSGKIGNEIEYQISGGHAPFHQVIRIQTAGSILFYGGDEAPQLQQMKHRFVAKYDHDGKKAMQLRSEWKEQGTREGWTFLFYHDVSHPTQVFN